VLLNKRQRVPTFDKDGTFCSAKENIILKCRLIKTMFLPAPTREVVSLYLMQ